MPRTIEILTDNSEICEQLSTSPRSLRRTCLTFDIPGTFISQFP